MKPASSALKAILASRQFFSADLFQFTLIGGGVLSYCSGDRDIFWNSITWSAGGTTGPYLDRKDNKSKCHWKTGVEVDTLSFDVLPGSATVNGQNFLPAIQQGVFDGATLALYRAFMSVYGDTTPGTVLMFLGRVGQIDLGRSLATFSVNSHLELFNQNMPRNLYQAGCVNTLYDASCTLSPNSFKESGTVAAGSVASSINATLTAANDYYDLGYVTFTSGALNGISRTVKTYTKGTPGTISFIMPFPLTPAPGDTFNIFAGCDKQQSTCQNKFSNLVNFRGFPYVPENSTAV